MPNPLSRRLRRRCLPQAVAVVLAVVLVATQMQAAEQDAVPPQAPTAAPQAGTPPPTPARPAQPLATSQLPVQQSLKVRALAGNGEMNDLERRIMAPLVIQVLDQNDRPMEGAEVVFRFPINGPGATFPDGKTSVTVRTNGTGQAAALNWMANGVGTFDVHVNASYGNQIGEATVSMTNATRVVEAARTSKGQSLWSHRWFKIAVIGGAAAIGVGVFLALRGGGKSGSTVTITPGSPGVSGP
jgi:hypothetical protein